MRFFSITIIFVLAGGLFLATACSSGGGESGDAPQTDAGEQRTANADPRAPAGGADDAEKAPTEEQTFEMKEIYPVETYSRKTPSETLRTFAKATLNKDAEGIKKTLSRGSLKMIEESAAAQNVSVETILLSENENSLTGIPEMKNERIRGDRATVEVKNRVTGGFDKMPLIRENGEWKLALDEFMEETMKRLTEEMNR